MNYILLLSVVILLYLHWGYFVLLVGKQKGNVWCNDMEPCFCKNSTCMIGGNYKSGNVYIEGKPVCDNSWDLVDAKVFCKEFGFSDALSFTTSSK